MLISLVPSLIIDTIGVWVTFYTTACYCLLSYLVILVGQVRGEKEPCPGGSAAAALYWEVLLGAARDVEAASARNRGLSPWGPCSHVGPNACASSTYSLSEKVRVGGPPYPW